MNKEMARVAKVYNKNRLMRFISISVDPENDTPSVLAEYSKPFIAENNKWEFVTGNQELIFAIAKNDFLVDAIQDTLNRKEIIHTPMIILLDPQKRIRGYYDSSRGADQVNLLIDEIKLLITEELRSIKTR
jgi:protein SCO1/2